MWAQAVHVHVCVMVQRFLCFSLQLALNIENFIIIYGIDWEISSSSVESIEKFHYFLWNPLRNFIFILGIQSQVGHYCCQTASSRCHCCSTEQCTVEQRRGTYLGKCASGKQELHNYCAFNPLSPLKSDQHVIPPYNNTAESFIEIMKIKEMIVNLRSFDC